MFRFIAKTSSVMLTVATVAAVRPATADYAQYDTENDTYQLVVPFDTNRRDHYIAVLQSGDAAARIMAIRQLAYFNDDLAKRAITEAINATNVTPAFEAGVWKSSSPEPVLLNTSDVQAAATFAIEQMASEQ